MCFPLRTFLCLSFCASDDIRLVIRRASYIESSVNIFKLSFAKVTDKSCFVFDGGQKENKRF